VKSRAAMTCPGVSPKLVTRLKGALADLVNTNMGNEKGPRKTEMHGGVPQLAERGVETEKAAGALSHFCGEEMVGEVVRGVAASIAQLAFEGWGVTSC